MKGLQTDVQFTERVSKRSGENWGEKQGNISKWVVVKKIKL